MVIWRPFDQRPVVKGGIVFWCPVFLIEPWSHSIGSLVQSFSTVARFLNPFLCRSSTLACPSKEVMGDPWDGVAHGGEDSFPLRGPSSVSQSYSSASTSGWCPLCSSCAHCPRLLLDSGTIIPGSGSAAISLAFQVLRLKNVSFISSYNYISATIILSRFSLTYLKPALSCQFILVHLFTHCCILPGRSGAATRLIQHYSGGSLYTIIV